MGLGLFADFSENTNTIEHPLYRAEIGDVNQQLFSVGRESFGLRLLRIRPVQLAVDEVLNYADLVRYAENFDRLFSEIFADAGDAVRPLDRKSGDRKVRTVRAHERNIGSVQCCDEG